MTNGPDNVADDLAGVNARAETAWCPQRGRWMNFGDGLAKAGYRDGFAGLEHLLKYGETGGFEFGDGDVVHVVHERKYGL